MTRRRNNKKGSILIVALWALCLLSTFVVYSGLNVRQKLNLVGRLDNRESLHFIGEAGVNAALLELKRKDAQDAYFSLNESWSNNPFAFKEVSLGAGSFTVSQESEDSDFKSMRFGMRDENSKININKADIKVLARLLEIAAGLNDQRALSLAHAIVDWRDKDSFFQHPQYGAEDSDYKNLDEPYEAKDSDFEVKEELLMIIGITPEIFESIEDLITVYGEGKININTTPREVFLVMGLSDSLTEKILLFRKGEDMLEGTFDDNVFTSTATIVPEMSQEESVSSGEIAELSRFIESEIFATSSSDFMIKCTSKLNKKNDTAQITAVASREGFIKYWRQDY